ncbi:MAG TPA: AAC(3) family N-acetyltransferase [Armatimonadota bacterium]|nr:AAC(3) family N-acetyltransferase [Armatimonadota bacterium]
MVTVQDITSAVQRMGLSGLPLCVHASLRSFGRVDGGASAVVAGLLGKGCTVLVPTFSWTFAVPPPARFRRPRNAWDYDDKFEPSSAGEGRIFTPDSNEIDVEDMGAIPASVIAMPERVRGCHPLCSFSAIGPLAARLVSGQTPLHVWAPLEALAEAGGSVVLMGVGLEKMTLLHLAEQTAGRNPFRRWANGTDGDPIEVEAGGCSDGFGNLLPVLRPLQSECKVGTSRWLIFPVSATLEAVTAAIRADPMITHCPKPDCGRCNDAAQGGPVLDD